MIYQVDMDDEVRLLVGHMTPGRKKKIKASLREISVDPYAGKPLQNKLLGLQSYRMGSFRIIYSINKNKKIIHIITIGPRRTVYEELERYFKKP